MIDEKRIKQAEIEIQQYLQDELISKDNFKHRNSTSL